MSQPFKNSILIIDDEENMLDMLSVFLRKSGYEVVTAADGQQGLDYASSKPFDFILCDLKMPRMDGLQFLEEIKKCRVDSTVIMMSAYATVDTAVTAMKNGAYDFVTKPFKMDEILCILGKGAERMRLKQENRQLRHKVLELERGRGFEAIVGESREVQDIVNLARRVAGYDTTVLITGESGTGKELIARGIHQASGRSNGPFVSVNCGAIPENLLESEFFGYVKGAFTGADADRKGLFEAASDGTLLLDEIGDMPLAMQVKLLRVLQEGEIKPVGANTQQKIDVRILAATSKNLEDAVARRTFREDLYYRLNVLQLHIPPLRKRASDIQPLANHFIQKVLEKLGSGPMEISSQALHLLMRYGWPGNVRELENVIERAVILTDGQEIQPEDLADLICKDQHDPHIEAADDADNLSVKAAMAKTEARLIRLAMKRARGNKSKAAELLELSYPSLLIKIKKYNIEMG